jgi:hypothetical protein
LTDERVEEFLKLVRVLKQVGERRVRLHNIPPRPCIA